MTCEETGIKYAGKIVAKSSLAKAKAKQKVRRHTVLSLDTGYVN